MTTKLLIVTQAVDTGDPILGFFVRWIEEFAKHVERVEVICLNKEGKHKLPANVRIHSLGKERGEASRVTYALRFLTLIWRLRNEYDTVFVHMNPEYIVLGGLLWRIWDKKIALWYMHKNVDLKLCIAVLLSDIIFTASKESFRLRTKKCHVTGHGIDTNFFSPDSRIQRETSILSAGRLSQSKRHDLVIRAAEHFQNQVHIVGDGPERRNLENLVGQLSLSERVHFLGPQTQEQLREEYRKAEVFLHTSETGSLDKMILEALACGLPVITTSALAGLPIIRVSAMPDAIAKAIPTVRQTETEPLVAYVREHHSLSALIPRVLALMDPVFPDPKAFYDTVMTEKLGVDYESARWKSSPLLKAQYAMTKETIRAHVIPLLPTTGSVLEVGPGPGTWTKILRSANPNISYTLVDISHEMLEHARAILSSDKKAFFVESDLLAFSSDEIFDGFFSSRAIEYMPNKRAVAEKIFKLLRPGARGAIITKMPKPFFDWLRGRTLAALHQGQIAPNILARHLRAAGLRVIKTRPATATVPLFHSAVLNRTIFRLTRMFPAVFPFSLFAESYIVVFGKPL